ncbi:hypothetical protein NDI49_13690 [Trichocoleus sp. ST-U3]
MNRRGSPTYEAGAIKPSENAMTWGASQQAQVFAFSDAGGSAVLDANIPGGVSTNPEGEAIAHPIASNFSSTTRTTGDA